MKIENLSFAAIQDALEINKETGDENWDEDKIVICIERRVAELMEEDFGLLMSYLYRLDIKEAKINACLDPNSTQHPYTCLAYLIWNRQIERLKTKKKYPSNQSIDEEWKW